MAFSYVAFLECYGRPPLLRLRVSGVCMERSISSNNVCCARLSADNAAHRIIGLFSGDHFQGQRQAQWVEGSHHGLDLPQGRIILAVPELPQAVLPTFTVP